MPYKYYPFYALQYYDGIYINEIVADLSEGNCITEKYLITIYHL